MISASLQGLALPPNRESEPRRRLLAERHRGVMLLRIGFRGAVARLVEEYAQGEAAVAFQRDEDSADVHRLVGDAGHRLGSRADCRGSLEIRLAEHRDVDEAVECDAFGVLPRSQLPLAFLAAGE